MQKWRKYEKNYAGTETSDLCLYAFDVRQKAELTFFSQDSQNQASILYIFPQKDLKFIGVLKDYDLETNVIFNHLFENLYNIF